MTRLITRCMGFTIALFVSTPLVFANTKVVVKQDMDLVKTFADKDTRYVIKEDLDLRGNTVKIGKGCTLIFKGGSLANGTIVGNNTLVKAKNYEIFKRGYIRYRAYFENEASKRPFLLKNYHNCIILDGTWRNQRCGSKWTGLLNESVEDVMLALKNFVILHRDGNTVNLPKINAYGYETTKFPGNHIIDFNNSTISYPDILSVWEDTTIDLPEGAIPASIESGYGLISVSSNSTLKNLYLDGKSANRQDEAVRLGVSCVISIGNAKNVCFDNVSLSNVLGPGITAQSGAEDITFKNCKFFNIGEHIMYSHQYKGFCHFVNCTFDTWDSERISVYRNGLDYLYKHTPPINEKGISYDDLYAFDLSFNNCTFNNPKRVNSQGRTLGGFLTCSFPLVLYITDCHFVGIQPPLNPGGGSAISEQSGKYYKAIIRKCDGAPYVYPSKSNYNIVMEFYNCINIPFRTVYARRYDNCKLYIDLNESDIENVSSSFETEFTKPLVVKGCILNDKGKTGRINHPVFHRPIIFDECTFYSSTQRDYVPEVITVKAEKPVEVSFNRCKFNLTSFRVAGGKAEDRQIIFNTCSFTNVVN